MNDRNSNMNFERRTFFSTSAALAATSLFPHAASHSEAAENPAKISSRTDGDVYQVTVRLKTPKSGKDKRAPRPLDTTSCSVFIPHGVKTLRGATVNPFYEPTVGQQHWRTAAGIWKFAHIGLNYFGVKGDEFGETTITALKALADASGHPELAHLPLCIHGMSAGGGMTSRLVEALPSRVIAAAPVCLEVGPRDTASGGVPMMTVFGEKDGKQLEKLTEKLPIARADHAQWAIAPQWNAKHEWHNASNIVMPFYGQVIDQRLPKDANATHGPVKLTPLKEADGWLGDVSTWRTPSPKVAAFADYQGDRGQACWLPNAYTAALWQAFVAHDVPLKITLPHGISGKNPFVTFAADKPLEVKVAVSKGFDTDKIELFNGDRRLAEVDVNSPAAKLTDLKPGLHALIAVGTKADGAKVYSSPSAVAVV